MATRDEYKNAHHFRYVGWDPRGTGGKDPRPVNYFLNRQDVLEEAWDGPKPRFRVKLPGFRGSCGSLLIACDKNDTSMGVCGFHVQGLKNNESPLWCQPVFADMIPTSQDLGTLPFRN